VSLDAARDQIISLAARYAIPTMFFFSSAVVAGGLISYGSDTRDANRQAGVYVGRTLKGDGAG
jgi:putative tryptophan/tyrosine transport system substrate-binding protein